MSLLIRKAEHKDAEGIIQVHVDSIQEICSNDYSAPEIETWASMKFKPEVWRQRIDRDHFWVIDDNGVIRGFAHLAILDEEEGEVMGLYLTPPVLKKGLGKKLFLEMETLAVKYHLKRLSLLSTKTAKSFYERLGFRQFSSDTSVDIKGVPIACHPMMLELNIPPWNLEN
jgi:putative acetyltransferase